MVKGVYNNSVSVISQGLFKNNMGSMHLVYVLWHIVLCVVKVPFCLCIKLEAYF